MYIQLKLAQGLAPDLDFKLSWLKSIEEMPRTSEFMYY